MENELSLLGALGEEDRRAVLQNMHRRRFAKGEVIFHEGDPGDVLHVVDKGHVAVRAATPLGEEALLAVLGPGASFGEGALVTEERTRTATCRALDAVETRSLHRDDFHRLVAAASFSAASARLMCSPSASTTCWPSPSRAKVAGPACMPTDIRNRTRPISVAIDPSRPMNACMARAASAARWGWSSPVKWMSTASPLNCSTSPPWANAAEINPTKSASAISVIASAPSAPRRARRSVRRV